MSESLDQRLSHAGDQYPVERYLLWDSHFQMMNPFTYSSHRALMPKTLMLIEFNRLNPSAIDSDSLSHILKTEFFFLGRLAVQG